MNLDTPYGSGYTSQNHIAYTPSSSLYIYSLPFHPSFCMSLAILLPKYKFDKFMEEQRIGIKNGEYLRKVEVKVWVDSELLKIDPVEQVLTMENNTIKVPGGEWILMQSRSKVLVMVQSIHLLMLYQAIWILI